MTVAPATVASGGAIRRAWDAPAWGSEVPWPVIVVAVAFGAGAIFWSWHSGSMVIYNDARAHLDIARRVTDALTPGLAQLGTVWLPLDQMLLAPLVAIEPLWHSGMAGAIVSGAAFSYSAVRMYSLADDVFHSRMVGWTALLIYATNLNLLYIQSTALDEPLLLAFFVGAVYHLSRWTRTRSHFELFVAAFLTACATLTRYEGWALFGGAVVLVFLWSRSHERRSKATEANVMIFAITGGYGIGMWFLYNLIIFRNPLAFIANPGSAQAQQLVLEHVGQLRTAHNLGMTALTFSWDVLDICSVGVVILGVVGAAILVFRRSGRARSLFIMGLLITPVVFLVASLYLGQITIDVPQVAPHKMWNDVYGLEALPAISFGVAAVVSWRPRLALVILAVTGASMALMATQMPITLRDGRTGISSASSIRPAAVAAYLGSHYRGGEVLADDFHVSAVEFASGLPLRDFVTVGEHPYYERAIKDPRAMVEWAIALNGDAISKDMAEHPSRFIGFKMVFEQGSLKLFKRSESS